MKNRRRWLVVALLVLAGAVGWWTYSQLTAARAYIPGSYLATSQDGSETVVVMFSPDGKPAEKSTRRGPTDPG